IPRLHEAWKESKSFSSQREVPYGDGEDEEYLRLYVPFHYQFKKIQAFFSDSGPRRSSRLSADSWANTNASVATGHSWANENIDEGVRGESFDDSRPNTASTTGSMASSDAKSCDQEDETMSIGGTTLCAQKITVGVSELVSLLRTLGELCRLLYMYRCKEALDTYMKLPHRHYNTGWVLSQVVSDPSLFYAVLFSLVVVYRLFKTTNLK
ncbi:hypothetical protein EUTSA_v10000671mg, partial [Eutrema salsugineum]